MKQLSVFLLLAAALLPRLSSGQVPQLVNFQGRVAVGNINFDGTGQFKFALVNGNGNTTYWSNDGTSGGGIQPASAVSIPVSKGLYSVLLGNATLPNMGALPATVFTNADVRLRVWFSDGTNGFQLFSPDQRIAAVGYAIMAGNVPDGSISSAKLADGAVTLSKVGSDVRAGLGGTPSGGILLTENANASNLLASGFVKLNGVKIVTEEWESSFADTNIRFSSWNLPPPIWTGTEAYVFCDTMGQGGYLAARYHPGSNTWHTLPTNNQPPFMVNRAVWLGNELMVLGETPETPGALVAARYRPATDTWQVVNTNGAPPYVYGEYTEVFWTGTELLVLSSSQEGLRGGRYRPASDTWLGISTNNAPDFNSKVFWMGTELIVFTDNPSSSSRRYRPATDTWLSVNTNGAPSDTSGDAKVVWTGDALLVLHDDRITRYTPASNTWTPATTDGAPNSGLEDARVAWTGTELVVFDAFSGFERGASYNPATDTWRSTSPDVPPFRYTPHDPIWTGREIVIGFSFDTMDAFAGSRYNPTTDSWIGISHPAGIHGVPSFFLWTGEQALVFKQDMDRPHLLKWTPARTLYLYQKP